MARFPSIDSEGAFEAPEVQNNIKELVTGSTDGITVDTSVGTRVYVGDTMIYGDTGWRDVTGMLENGWTASTFQVKRYMDQLLFRVWALRGTDATSDTFLTLPQGYNWGGMGTTILISTTEVTYLAPSRALALSRGKDHFTSGMHTGSSTITQIWPSTTLGIPE